MKIKVTAEEVWTYPRTYCVDGVNSLESAAKCVERCYNHEYQPNTYCCQRLDKPVKELRIVSYEVVED